ncbi:error-prone DNA polymerase [Pseudidiomarina homiensis]|uniref:Error-prone DNA polymerase n=1 Tax=Pseudidiomarina homiensis TaxID=364198 RepID=A0A432Y7B9_9GAMM|nr:error-prone DNA polymerase [Pseudidiomarina homiensis]RUO56870.1 error-prone DNA polymerase [Pseudidiomarina homiensis]
MVGIANSGEQWRPSALNCVTNYSFLYGAAHPHEYIQRAVQLDYRALAITDECSVAGVVRAFIAMKGLAHQLKLLIGSFFVVADVGTLIVLAQNRQGYGQLCRLITLGRSRCAKGSYQVEISDFLQGLDDCLLLWRPQEQRFSEHLSKLRTAFSERLWLAYARHYQATDVSEVRTYQHYQRISQLPVVAVDEVLYPEPERQKLHDVMTAIRYRQTLSEGRANLRPNAEHYLRSAAQLKRCYPESWLYATDTIVVRCDFQLSELSYEYPAELVLEGMSATEHLRQLVYAGAKQRFPDGLRSDVQAKLEKELSLIAELKYEYFFLTIHDIVQFAQQRGILYQGRGSAANSVVCYCLQITAVNPDQVDVLFERFISKERDEPPDIDVDFEHQRREEVIQYIYKKYGRDRAALAATVIRYRLRSAFRDVGKALGFNEQELGHYLRQIDRRDQDTPWYEQLALLQKGLPHTERGRWLLQLTEQLRGFPRHLSQHVGGFVIAAGPLADLVPIERASMADRTVIQWDKDDLETLKLIKVDVLALGMLSALRRMLQLVAEHYQRPLDLASIPTEDPKVYQMLQCADSIGVFQIESRAQMNMLPRLRPATFYDLVVQIAIVRPGPIQGDMVHPYLRRRAGEEAVTYPSEEVRQVTERTLGVPIFQEQVIKLAMVAAGFSGGEADQLRRAMANWRSTGELQQFEQRLIAGMQERGYRLDFAQRIYQQICGFGEYGFPESHSASFANLAYASAWFKYHYPAAFYCGLLNSLPMGFYSADQLIQDARRHDVTILPVDIQTSTWHHQLVPMQNGMALRLGFCLVRGLNETQVQAVLALRPAAGFASLSALRRAGASPALLQRFAAADALKKITGHRYQSQWQTLAEKVEQLPLFVDGETSACQDRHVLELTPPTEVKSLAADYRVLGTSIRRHPLALLRERRLLAGVRTAAELAGCRHQQIVQVAGLVTCRQRPGTAGGVTFITLEDETGMVNVVIWQATARAQRQEYLTARLLKVVGTVEIHGEVIHVIAGRLEDGAPLLAQLEMEGKRSRDFH